MPATGPVCDIAHLGIAATNQDTALSACRPDERSDIGGRRAEVSGSRSDRNPAGLAVTPDGVVFDRGGVEVEAEAGIRM
jgi:hypothetical protein